MTDVDCFIELVRGKLSNEGKKVWDKAKDRHGRYKDLFSFVLKKIKGDMGKMSAAQLEGASIRAIVNFELKINKANDSWSFQNGGIEHLANDFFLLNEYLSAFGEGP
jgi:hypothetical protein